MNHGARASPQSPQRVLFVLEYYYPHIGGVETLFGQLAEGLAADGHQVAVITLWLPGTRDRETRNRVNIIRIKTPQWAQRYFFTALALPAVIRESKAADLVHTTTYNAAIPAWVGAALRGKPAVVTVHEVFAQQWHELPGLNRLAGYGFRFFEWSVLHLPFRHYICDSQFTRRRLLRCLRVPAAQASVVYPAVDYDFWDPDRYQPRDLRDELHLSRGSFTYLYFGRPGVSKGIEYLLEAVPRIRERLPDSYLVLLLARDPVRQYRQLLRRIVHLKIRDQVKVLDPVPRGDLPGYLLGVDCVVVPSISEGFGYSAVEAATLGCPVIATSGHAIEEVLEGSVQLVPPRDVAALAEAVIRVAAAKPRPISPRPRFDVRSHVRGVAAIYEQLPPS